MSRLIQKKAEKEGKGNKEQRRLIKTTTTTQQNRFKPNYIKITLNVNGLNTPIRRQRLSD